MNKAKQTYLNHHVLLYIFYFPMRRGEGPAVAPTKSARSGISSAELTIPVQRDVGGEEFVPYIGKVVRGRVGNVNAFLVDGLGGVVVRKGYEHVESSSGIARSLLHGVVLWWILLGGDVFDFSLSTTALEDVGSSIGRDIATNAGSSLGPTSEHDGSNGLLTGGVGILEGRGRTALWQGQEDDAARQSADYGDTGAYHLHGGQTGKLGRAAIGVVVVEVEAIPTQLATSGTRGRGHPALLEVIALLHGREEVLPSHGPEGVAALGHDGLGGQPLPGGADELAKDAGGVVRARSRGGGGRLAAAGAVDAAGSTATAGGGDLVSRGSGTGVGTGVTSRARSARTDLAGACIAAHGDGPELVDVVRVMTAGVGGVDGSGIGLPEDHGVALVRLAEGAMALLAIPSLPAPSTAEGGPADRGFGRGRRRCLGGNGGTGGILNGGGRKGCKAMGVGWVHGRRAIAVTLDAQPLQQAGLAAPQTLLGGVEVFDPIGQRRGGPAAAGTGRAGRSTTQSGGGRGVGAAGSNGKERFALGGDGRRGTNRRILGC